MNKDQYKNQYRQARIDERRAQKQIERETGWQVWAAGMRRLKEILQQEAPKLEAMAAADWRTDRILPPNWNKA